MKDLAGLSEPLKKLIEVVARGIGILYEPTHIKKIAQARVIEIEKISSAIQDAKLPIQYEDGKISIDGSTQNLFENTEKRLLFTEAKKQKNIDDIVSEAYYYLENEQEVSSEPLQDEWINRFFDIAGEISSEDLKTIWSKILAEEIKKPGTCSLRTLEILKNISRDEAKIFNKISNFVIKHHGKFFLPYDESLLQIMNINYSDIMKMDEASLMNSTIGISDELIFDESNKQEVLMYNNKIIFCEAKGNNNVHLQLFPLTESGKDIFNIIVPVFNEKFFEQYIDFLNDRMTISYSTIINKDINGNIEYEMPVTKL